MKPSILPFIIENPQTGNVIFGKKQFHGFKNRSSKEFSLQHFRDLASKEQKDFREPKSFQHSPVLSPSQSRLKYESPKRIEEYNPAALESRLLKLDEIRKKINLKIFEMKQAPIINEPVRKYLSPPIRRVSPEKFLEGITYSKADLDKVQSRFIPTDRNTNKMLEDYSFRPAFKIPMYTKSSPKIQMTNPFV